MVSSIEVVDDDICECMDLFFFVLVEYFSFNLKKIFSMVGLFFDCLFGILLYLLMMIYKVVVLFFDYYIDMFDVCKCVVKSNIDCDIEFFCQYDFDCCFIYVGGFFFDVIEEEMFEIFFDVGEVIKVNMVQCYN